MDTTVRYTASDDLRSGVELQGGRYRIISTLGRGGFGITYLAEQVNVRRKVCIKEFFPKAYYKRDGDSGAISLSSDGFAELMSKFKDKFIKEAYTIAELDHPNIIRIHDVFEENSTAYYVMEYIDGESLQSKVNSSGAMAESAAHEYIKQVAAALDHVHSQQIMHLDVKPGNVMVRAKDNRAILIDFGLAKHYDAESGDATSTTIVGVSHGYAPMEQYKEGGISSFSPSTDIYSLGATLYFLVVGKTPPSADVVGEDGIGALPSGLSRGTRSAIERAMQHRRKDRPQSIADFLALLGGKGKPVAPVPSTHKKRSNWWLWLLLLLLIAVGGVVGYIMSGGDNPEPTPASSTINIGDAVDLGLSVKWATCNVGATRPEDYGDYFAWGEISPKTSYTEDNSKTYGKSMEDIGGDSRYDAATANWGSGWRLPTASECNELVHKCTWTWTKLNGVNGYEVKSKKNGNSIFLPAAGDCWGDTPDDQGSISRYWSSTPTDTFLAHDLLVGIGCCSEAGGCSRYGGLSVRPVAE